MTERTDIESRTIDQFGAARLIPEKPVSSWGCRPAPTSLRSNQITRSRRSSSKCSLGHQLKASADAQKGAELKPECCSDAHTCPSPRAGVRYPHLRQRQTADRIAAGL